MTINLKRKKNLFLKIGLIVFVLSLTINLHVKLSTKNLIFNNINQIQNVNYGVVFVAGINNNKPSDYLKARLDLGITLYQQGKI